MPRLVLVDTSAGIVKKACGCHRSHSSGHSEDSWESGGFFAPPLPPSLPPLFLGNHTSPPALPWLLHQILLRGNTATTRLPPMPPQQSLPLFTLSISSISATRDPSEATSPEGRSLVRGHQLQYNQGPNTLGGDLASYQLPTYI